MRYCGNCGAPVVPGAQFCGRCGAPQAQIAVATMPTYAYPSAPGRPRTGSGRVTSSQVMVAAGLLIILSVVTVAGTAFAVSQVLGTHKPCTQNCGARIVTPLPAPASYKSSAFGFQVDYNPNWTVRNQDAQSVALATKMGQLSVVGAKSGQPLDQVMQSAVSALPTSQWQDVAHVSDLKGAHIGDQDGVGAVYSANLVGSNATATPVRFILIAATKNGVTVVIFGADPADTKDYPNGIPEGEAFDALCQQFQWG